MEALFQIFKDHDRLHHAYIVVGEPHHLIAPLVELFTPKIGAENVVVQTFDTFGVDQSRLLKDLQTRRPQSGESQFFIVTMNFVTPEAQNALLKTLEEPQGGSHFFIIVRKEDILLPTIRSRCEVIHAREQHLDSILEKLCQDFLKADPPKRLLVVADLTGEEGDKQRVIDFLTTLEVLLARHLTPDEKNRVLPELAKLRSYLYAPAASSRLVLEHLSFAIPQVY